MKPAKVNSKGRTFFNGYALSNELRTAIIDEIVSNGDDMSTGFFPSNFEDVSRKLKVKGSTVRDIWRNFVTSGDYERKRNAGRSMHLQQDDLDFIEFIKSDRPSISAGEILKEIIEVSNVPGGTSKSAIGRAVRDKLPCGTMTWKRMTRPVAEKFTENNIRYCQHFLNYISTIDPHKLKFFDEAGIKLPDAASPRYGHSLKGQHCVEVMRRMESPNITLNLLCGADGITYANTVDGASNMFTFLNFFDEASHVVQENGRPALDYGDHIIMDNAAIHHYAAGQILGSFLDDIGCVLIYLPTYSPEFNPTEFVFNKMRSILKRYEYREILRQSLHVGVYEAISNVTSLDMRGFYRYTGYINI